MSTSIQDLVRAAVQARKDSLIALRERIATTLADIPVGVHLEDDDGPVCSIVPLVAGGSQNEVHGEWEVALDGWGAMVGNRLLCESVPDSYHDGSNCHYRRTPAYTSRDADGWAPDWLPGDKTREIVRRLPRAVERYIERCRKEAEQNAATLA